MQLDVTRYITNIVRKRKWAASTCKGGNGLNWENLNEKMELLGHLKVIVPLGINLVEFGRTKENQTRSHS